MSAASGNRRSGIFRRPIQRMITRAANLASPKKWGFSMKALIPSPSMGVSLLALVVALGGAGIAATGGNFILGQNNSATTQSQLTAPINSEALRVSNTSAAANATGLLIATNTARPPMKVNSAVRVAKLNADMVDGRHAADLARVAYAQNHNTNWTEDERTTLLSVTLVAPQDGFVTLSGGVTANYFDGCAYCATHIRFRVDGTTDTSTKGFVIAQTGFDLYAPLTHTVTLPVSAGTHTYDLVASWYDLDANTLDPSGFYDPTLNAQFIPFNGTGAAVPPPVAKVSKKPPPGRSSRSRAQRG